MKFIFEVLSVILVIIKSHQQQGDVLLAFYVLCQAGQQFFEVVVEVLLKSINHTVVVVFLNGLLNVLAFQKDLLLPASNGINQVCVIIIQVIVELVLIDDMLIFSDEEVDNCSIVFIILA